MRTHLLSIMVIVLVAVCNQAVNSKTVNCDSNSDCPEGSKCILQKTNGKEQKVCHHGRKGEKGETGEQNLDGNEEEKVETTSLKQQSLDGGISTQGDPSTPSYFVFAKHSQSSNVSVCPDGMTQLWEGYSLLNVEGNLRAHQQDLGSGGSCLRRFNTMPFMPCNVDNVCDYASRTDKSYWLSTNEAIPMMPVGETAIEPYISRCVVCGTQSYIMAVHSQTTDLPNCPFGWSDLWSGYSFLMYTGEGSVGGGQSLSSPGSCLEEFRAIPFIECNGALGTCHFFRDNYSIWLATIEENSQFRTPLSETLKAGYLLNRVSRCKVCAKIVSN